MGPVDGLRARSGSTALAPAPSATARVSVVVPVLNARAYLPRMTAAVLGAARRLDGVEILFVDNGSTDGSYEYLRSLPDEAVRVLRAEGLSIAAVRNHGARHASGDYLSFIDADCLVGEGYFEDALAALGRTGAVATGCEAQAPTPPHWIEATWHQLHYVGRDRFVHYINSANFFISRSVFREIGGFEETLPTGEDSEIGLRIRAAGHTIYECTRVAAVHLGNPKSLRHFFRRTVWHALGMFGTVGRKRLDKPTAMMLVHLLASSLALALPALGTLPVTATLAVVVALQLVAPAATVAFRYGQTRRVGRPVAAVVLYWLYYWGRLYALFLILLRRDGRYRK